MISSSTRTTLRGNRRTCTCPLAHSPLTLTTPSCFCQLKLHPDIMPAFSIMLADFLFLQAALPFGADFSPQNWEICRRIIEDLAEKLFHDTSLRSKHRQYLDRITFAPDLRHHVPAAVPAKPCSQRKGVRDEQGRPLPTPHRLFVDDDIYADRFDVDRMEQAIAASIEAIFILLGVSGKHARVPPPSPPPISHKQSLTNARTPSRSTNLKT